MPIGSLRDYAPDLELSPEGWWSSPALSDISYPEEGNALCFLIEESSFWFVHRNCCILETLKHFPPDGAFFDIGGGNGCVARAIQESGLEVVLIEPGVAGVRNAIKRGVRQVVRSTLGDAGLLEGTLPAAGLFDVIEHIEDDLGFLLSINRLLAPGGRVYITVPAYQLFWSDQDILAGHFRRYTLPGVIRILQKTGYAIDFATYFFSFLPLPVLLRRVLPYRLGLGSTRISEGTMRSDHEISHPLARRMLHTLTQWELARIARRHRIACGGSCLVVARKL